MKIREELGPKGRRLLAMLVGEIKRGRIKKGDPHTFISYGEALTNLGLRDQGRAGQQLQREGLAELRKWTKSHPEIPKIDGLVIVRSKGKPSSEFAHYHGHFGADWETWWMEEAARAIEFNWTKFLDEEDRRYPVADSSVTLLHEKERVADYRSIITIEPGKRGGKPCIRGMRITVADVLGWLATGMSRKEICSDFPELIEQDILACLAFAAEKEKHAVSLSS